LHLFILILKSYLKYTIDRDIADNADKNRKKTAKSWAHVTFCSQDTSHILKIMSFISSRVNHPGSIRKLSPPL